MLEANEMKVLKRIVGKAEIERIRSQKSENPAVSNLLISGWKGEEEKREEENCVRLHISGS